MVLLLCLCCPSRQETKILLESQNPDSGDLVTSPMNTTQFPVLFSCAHTVTDPAGITPNLDLWPGQKLYTDTGCVRPDLRMARTLPLGSASVDGSTEEACLHHHRCYQQIMRYSPSIIHQSPRDN